jgi:hypothetical protein
MKSSTCIPAASMSLLGAFGLEARERVVGEDDRHRFHRRLQALEHVDRRDELARGAREQPEHPPAALGEDEVRAAAGLHHQAPRRLGDGARRQHDVGAEGAEKEHDALVDLALDQRGGPRRVTGVVEQLQLELMVLAGELDAAHLLVDVFDRALVAAQHIEPGFGRRARHGHRSAEHDLVLLRPRHVR